jgi:large subunit ribosomal protein L4
MKLKVFRSDASESVEKDFDGIPAFEGDRGLRAVKQVVLAIQANRRKGTSCVKTRSTVHGTGKKPFRQKGTGIARQGTKVGPQHYHGAVAHGPQPRDFSQKVNRKVRLLALQRALYDRANDGGLAVIEEWKFDQPKAKMMNGIVGKIAAPKGKVLIVDAAFADNAVLSARNLERVDVTRASDLNVFDLLRYETIICSEPGLKTVLDRANSTVRGRGPKTNGEES